MREMQIYLELLGFVQALRPQWQATISDRGCLAMAAQWLSAREKDNPEVFGRWMDILKQQAKIKDENGLCFSIFSIAYRDYKERIRPKNPEQEHLIGLVYDVKAAAAKEGKLRDFILTGNYLYFPDFFRQYDALTHA